MSKLSADELALADKLGFDLDVVKLVKATVGVPLREYKPGDEEKPNKDPRGPGIHWSEAGIGKQIEILTSIRGRSPDAHELIDGWIETLKNPSDPKILEAREADKRNQEFWKKAEPYKNYIAAESARIYKEAQSGSFSMPHFWMDNGQTVEARLDQMRTYFDSMPEPKAAKAAKPLVGMYFWAEYFPWKSMRTTIQKQLSEKGYRLDDCANFGTSKDFTTLEEARLFMAEHPELPGLKVITLKGLSYEIGGEDNSKRLFSAEQAIEKIGPDKYLVVQKPCYRVSTHLQIVIMVKTGRKRKSKFQLVIDSGTSAPNAGLGPDAILDQLKAWDELYDLEITDASSDSVGVTFKKLPNDLRMLCSEIMMFCTDLDVLHDDGFDNNTYRVREFAHNLRQSKHVSFWWD